MDLTPAVVTLVRNRTTHLRNLVLGLDASTPVDVDLVVVQMGGEDPSPAWSGTRRRVRLARCGRPGLPLAAARNLGARTARSPVLVFLDVDCIPGPTTVARYAAALAHHDVVLMGGVGYLDEGATARPWTPDALDSRSRPHPARPHPDAGVHPCSRPELFWSLSFGVRRSTLLDVVGGFDESYVGYGAEDTDFARRLARRGVDLAWLGDAVCHHQHHDRWDPPLNHLVDIVANARHFHATWDEWPMQGWLTAFRDAGLVAWDPTGDRLDLLRPPTRDELATAHRTRAVGR